MATSREPIRPPELSELETFVLALDQGSIAGAARALRISTQAAAKRIRQLEVLAHTPLLVRGRRGVSATGTGARLYPIARELLAHRQRALAVLGGAPDPDPSRIAGMHQLLGRAPAPAADELFKDTETVLAAIFHATTEAIIITRARDGMIHEINDAAARLLGYEQPDLRGHKVSDVDLWEDPGRRDECVRAAVATRRPLHAELVARTRRRERLLVGARFEAIELRDGVHIVLTVRQLPAGGMNRAPKIDRRRANDRADPVLVARFAEALRTGSLKPAQAAADEALDRGLDVAGIHTQLIEPAMRRIGELWEQGKLSAGEEHLATAISYQLAAHVFHRALRAPPASRERVMMTAVQGERHALGLRLAADVLEGAGYEVFYLGADVPLEALLSACEIHQPDVLGLTVSMSHNVPAMIWEIREITQLGRPPRMMVGGRAVADAVEKGLGVPMVEHSDHVLAVVEQLLASPPTGTSISAELAALVPRRPPAGPTRTTARDTIPAAFAEAAIAGAEAVRDSARREFAMERLANHDSLTGLHNRRAFDNQLELIAESGAPPGTLLAIDIDRFKMTNDTHGHQVGDETLRRVAQIIHRNVRADDFAARVGGDEFVVLLSTAIGATADAIAERIRAAVANSSAVTSATVSIGIADVSVSGRLAGEVADRALYAAKDSGGNRVARP